MIYGLSHTLCINQFNFFYICKLFVFIARDRGTPPGHSDHCSTRKLKVGVSIWGGLGTSLMFLLQCIRAAFYSLIERHSHAAPEINDNDAAVCSLLPLIILNQASANVATATMPCSPSTPAGRSRSLGIAKGISGKPVLKDDCNGVTRLFYFSQEPPPPSLLVP